MFLILFVMLIATAGYNQAMEIEAPLSDTERVMALQYSIGIEHPGVVGLLQRDRHLINTPLKDNFYRVNNTSHGIFGDSCLHIATMYNRNTLVKMLIELGAAVNQPNLQQIYPLHIAIGLGNLTIAKMLVLAGAFITCKNCHGNTIVHLATKSKSCLEYVLSLKGIHEVLDAKNFKGHTALDIATDPSCKELLTSISDKTKLQK